MAYFSTPKLLSASLMAGLLLGLTACGDEGGPERSAERETIDVCGAVTAEQLATLYRKPLLPNASRRGCYWNEKPGGMAYRDIRVSDADKSLREFFNAELSPQTRLETIDDLGAGGLMTVSEGDIGVVVIEKDGRFLQSAVTFLDIEPGSDKQAVLWDVYRALLEKL